VIDFAGKIVRYINIIMSSRSFDNVKIASKQITRITIRFDHQLKSSLIKWKKKKHPIEDECLRLIINNDEMTK